MEIIKYLDVNTIGGVGFAVFAIVVGAKLTIGVRDYIFILIATVLSTISVIEHLPAGSSLTTSCIVGFSLGLIADDLYLNLKTALPEFIRDTIYEILNGVKHKIKKFLGLK